MNCTRHRLSNGQLSMKVYAGAGVCSGSALAVSLNEDISAGRNSASYWVHRAPLLVMLWATINRDHCPYLGLLMQYISGWLFSVFGGTLIFLYLLRFIFITSFCGKKMTVPKWRSHFHIGNSKMVLLHLQGKFECLAQLSTWCLPTVKPHRLPFPADHISVLFTLTRVCPASLSSWFTFQVECPSPSSSSINSSLVRRLVLVAVSANPQAVGLTSAPWTSP